MQPADATSWVTRRARSASSSLTPAWSPTASATATRRPTRAARRGSSPSRSRQRRPAAGRRPPVRAPDCATGPRAPRTTRRARSHARRGGIIAVAADPALTRIRAPRPARRRSLPEAIPSAAQSPEVARSGEIVLPTVAERSASSSTTMAGPKRGAATHGFAPDQRAPRTEREPADSSRGRAPLPPRDPAAAIAKRTCDAPHISVPGSHSPAATAVEGATNPRALPASLREGFDACFGARG